jgi:arylformamidase
MTANAKPGHWIDLSRVIREDMPKIAFFPSPKIRLIRQRPMDRMNVTEITLACHVGTHVDAPAHFVEGGRTIDQIPLDQLYGRGVIWRIKAEPAEELQAEVFEAATPSCEAGDIVFLHTSWSSRWGNKSYDDHPYLASSAAEWLVEHRVKMLGVDFSTPDLPVRRRGDGFDWPVHQILLSNNVLVVEHLHNLGTLAGRRVEVVVLALNIHRADGAPARVIARAAGEVP